MGIAVRVLHRHSWQANPCAIDQARDLCRKILALLQPVRRRSSNRHSIPVCCPVREPEVINSSSSSKVVLAQRVALDQEIACEHDCKAVEAGEIAQFHSCHQVVEGATLARPVKAAGVGITGRVLIVAEV